MHKHNRQIFFNLEEVVLKSFSVTMLDVGYGYPHWPSLFQEWNRNHWRYPAYVGIIL